MDKYIKLCMSKELEEQSRRTRKKAIILSVAISILALITFGIMIFFLK